MNQYNTIKERVYQCNMDLIRHNVVVFTFGNVSGIDRSKEIIAIKPSGVAYDALKPEDIVIVDLEGRLVEGSLKPSSDTKTHLILYQNFPNIGGVAHTHSPYATAWAQAKRPIPILGTTHADHLSEEIPVTSVMSDEMIRGNYEEQTGHQILNTFKKRSYEKIEMVLVASHGPFTWGKTPEKAVYNAVILEELAKMAMLTCQINPKIDPLKQALIDKHCQRKHGKNAYYGQE
jgi:L-ribulose-5-phosphate 4-epimerase